MNTQLSQQMEGNSPPFVQFQTKRVSTGTILAGVIGNVAVTWDGAFPDTNYTVAALIQSGALSLVQIDSLVSVSTAGCVIAVKNITLLSQSATLHVMAIHD